MLEFEHKKSLVTLSKALERTTLVKGYLSYTRSSSVCHTLRPCLLFKSKTRLLTMTAFLESLRYIDKLTSLKLSSHVIALCFVTSRQIWQDNDGRSNGQDAKIPNQ